jgi:tetrahydromethanopterin S-methyltransferase subunit A
MVMTAAVDRFTAISGSCRIENLLINKLIHNTEKSTRYFLPGAFFLVLFILSSRILVT